MNSRILPLDPRAKALRLYLPAQVLRDDAQGLTMLAYALGAAAVLAPTQSCSSRSARTQRARLANRRTSSWTACPSRPRSVARS